jgi:hypothetical protein
MMLNTYTLLSQLLFRPVYWLGDLTAKKYANKG